MVKLIAFIVGSLTGTVGWLVGIRVGPMTAFFTMLVATGVGMYYGHKVARDHLED